MDFEIVLPKFGWTMQEATITDWLKNVGERVTEGEPLFVIETEKANQEVEAPASGVLREIQIAAGETVPVGTVIGLIEAAAPSSASAPPASMPVTPSAPLLRAAQVMPLDGMRRVIAERMMTSLRQSAQLTLTTEVDLTATAARRASDVSPTAIVVQVVARTLIEHSLLNSAVAGDEIHVWDQRNIGVAVALPGGGLVVPVVRTADTKMVAQITVEITALAEKARANQLSAEELADGTFSVTNLGMYGIDAFTPILNPPQTAILGVGRWVEKPGIFEDKLVPRTLATLSLTIDHRVVDGAPGAAFLQAVAQRLSRGEFT